MPKNNANGALLVLRRAVRDVAVVGRAQLFARLFGQVGLQFAHAPVSLEALNFCFSAERIGGKNLM